MTQNAAMFKQAGYSDEDALTLSRVAALYQNVADSEVSAQEAGSFVISQLKAYSLQAILSKRYSFLPPRSVILICFI